MNYTTLYSRNSCRDFWEKDQKECNCGSFALNLTSWFVPYLYGDELDDEDWDDAEIVRFHSDERDVLFESLVAEGYSKEEVMEVVIENDWEFILMTCPFLETISREEINEKDRVIAYRLLLDIPGEREEFSPDRDTDFHFRVLIDGEWWEKNGAWPIHRVFGGLTEDPWIYDDKGTLLVYEGPVRYARFIN